MENSELEQIYDRKFGNNIGVKSLGWGSEKSQKERFDAFVTSPIDVDKDSVLDLGCGYGDFYNYFRNDNYVGYDLRRNAIDIARNRYPGVTFSTTSIFETQDDGFDWVFGSGIFCFQEKDWAATTRQTIDKMFSVCRKGMAFNLLTTPKNPDPDMKYCSVYEVFQLIEGVTKRFVLKHDYKENDITVFLYKK